MFNVDFMLGQRRRILTYINPPLSIPQHKHDRSTPAQCFIMLGLCRKQWTNDKPILDQCILLTETAHQ